MLYTEEEFIEIFKPIITKIYKENKDMPKETFTKIVKEVVKDLLTNLKEEDIKTIDKDFAEKLTLALSNKESSLLDKIDSFKYALTYQENVKKLEKIAKILEDADIDNLYDIVIKSDNLKYILKSVVDKNIDAIKKDKIDIVFYNEIILSLIDIYVFIYSIPVKSEETDTFTSYDLQINNLPLLTPEEETELGYRLLAGDENAKNILIERNLRLARQLALKKYQVLGEKDGTFDRDDLIQEANIGLIKAASKYDVSKGFRFTTYATWWIKQNLNRSLADKARTIRMPVHFVERLQAINIARHNFQAEFGYDPSTKELSEMVNIDEKTLKETLRRYNNTLTLSLDQPTGINDEKDVLANVISDGGNVEEEVEKTLLSDYVQKLLTLTLDEREIFIIRYRFGIHDGIAHTLEETGSALNITRERVRQIEAKAIEKLQKVGRTMERKASNAIVTSKPVIETKTFASLLPYYKFNEIKEAFEILPSNLQEEVVVIAGEDLNKPINFHELTLYQQKLLNDVVIPKISNYIYNKRKKSLENDDDKNIYEECVQVLKEINSIYGNEKCYKYIFNLLFEREKRVISRIYENIATQTDLKVFSENITPRINYFFRNYMEDELQAVTSILPGEDLDDIINAVRFLSREEREIIHKEKNISYTNKEDEKRFYMEILPKITNRIKANEKYKKKVK